jgi:hypothetical protein
MTAPVSAVIASPPRRGPAGAKAARGNLRGAGTAQATAQVEEPARLRIEQGSLADLDHWGESVLTASSLSEVLEG